MLRREFLGVTGAAALSPVLSPMLPRLSYADGKPHRTLRPGVGNAPLMGTDKPPTEVWSYNDMCPGPVIRIPRNQEVHVRVENALAEPTSVHWHGIRIDNAMDGVSGLTQDPINTGESFSYKFASPDAGTFWYHSHHRSWEQVGRGLYGALIVDEDEPVAVDHDLLFIADDWLLNDDGSIDGGFGDVHDASHGGRMGNWLTVNGDTKPTYRVRPGARVRLRCISAANARIMAFAFPGLNGWVAAIDGQPLATPEPLGDALVLAPAQRADLIVDIPATPGAEFEVMEVSIDPPIGAATIVVEGEPVRAQVLAEPLVLPANPINKINLNPIDSLNVDLVMEGGAMGRMRGAMHNGRMFDMRSLVLDQGQAWAFNGVAGRTETPLAKVELGRTLTVNMVNDTRWPHAMHLHGHHFKVIERNGQTVADAPWRDTELVNVGEKVRIAFVADNPGKWLFHCHMLEHHMAGMGTWISVG